MSFCQEFVEWFYPDSNWDLKFRKLPFYPLNYRTAFMCFSVRLFPCFAHETGRDARYFEKSPPSYAHLTYSAPHV